MAHKRAAQLNREIKEALAKSPARKARSHATIGDTWDVAMDALLEHDTSRAIEIVKHIDVEESLMSMPQAFSKALGKVPAKVRKPFENAFGLVSKQGYDWDTFADAAAKTFWEQAYRNEVENLSYEAQRVLRGYNDPAPAAYALGKKFAKATREKLTEPELTEIAEQFTPEQAGDLGAMQSLGHGIGWFDEGIETDPPRGFDYDVKLHNAVWTALKREAKEEGVELE